MKDFNLWILLFMSSFVNCSEDPCIRTYDETITSGGLPCSDCVFNILPSNNSIISLKGQTAFPAIVTETYYVGQGTKSISKGGNIFDRKFSFLLSAPSSGFIVERDSNGSPCYYFDQLEFSRITTDPDGYCKQVLHTIGSTVTVVQTKEISSSFHGECVYELVRSPLLTNDTLYISHKGGKLEYSQNGIFEKALFPLLIIQNFSSIILRTINRNDFFSEDNPVRIPEIQAVVRLNNDCHCGPESIFITDNRTTNIRSPGFGDFMCPSLLCTTKLIFPKSNSSLSTSRYFVVMRIFPFQHNTLNLKSDIIDQNLDNSTLLGNTTLRFLTSSENLTLTYITPEVVPVYGEGRYDINITRVKIEKECDCSTFMNKKYEESNWTARVVIPAKCDIMYCEWNFYSSEDGEARELVIEINTLKHSNNDEILIWSKNVSERHNGSKFVFPRKTYLPDCQSGCHVSFWRTSSAEESTITVSWKPLTSDSCSAVQTLHVAEEYQIITSPNYPNSYFTKNSCDFLFETEIGKSINVHIQEIDLEQVHDHLSFYDGISTKSRRIEHFTGTHSEKSLESSSNFLYVRFHSDNGETANRGYHFVVYAVKRESGSHLIRNIMFVFLFLLLVGGAVAIGSFVWKRKNSIRTSFGNQMVRFHSEDNESTVTIAE